MEIDISRLYFDEMKSFIDYGDFSMESDYILKVKKYREKEVIKFSIEKVKFPVQITNREFKKDFQISNYIDTLKKIIEQDKASFKATVNGNIAGIIIAEYEPWENDLFIYELAVDKQFRKMGIATRLLKAIEKVAAARNVFYMMLQVDYRNYPAELFYTKRGFEITGVIYRSSPVIIMRKCIKKISGIGQEF